MFSPLDILYIVLAFCALWLTAGIFWLIWQIATIFRTVNTVANQAQETLCKIEDALAGIREKFEHTSSLLGVVADAGIRIVEHVIEKKTKKKTTTRSRKKRTKEEVIDV